MVSQYYWVIAILSGTHHMGQVMAYLVEYIHYHTWELEFKPSVSNCRGEASWVLELCSAYLSFPFSLFLNLLKTVLHSILFDITEREGEERMKETHTRSPASPSVKLSSICVGARGLNASPWVWLRWVLNQLRHQLAPLFLILISLCFLKQKENSS